MGNRAYGVGAAAQVYYGKTLDQLTLAEIAMIAGLPKAPSKYNPIAKPERALQRRDWILGRMLSLKKLPPVSISLQSPKLIQPPIMVQSQKSMQLMQQKWFAKR